MAGERIRLEVKARDQLGSRASRRARKQGLIPGVLYGRGKKPHAFVIGERELRAALGGPSGMRAILDVVVDEQKTTHSSVVKDYQQDPLRGRITHVDLHEVRLDQPINALAVVEFVGESPGVKAGGVLTQVLREVMVEALPLDVPERIELDLSGTEIGTTLRVADLPVPENVKVLEDPETVLASISAPRLVVEAEPGEAAEGEEAVEGAPEEPTAEAEATAEGETAEPSEG